MERKMRNVHPREILKMELIEGRKLSVSKIAELLDTTDLEIYNILNCDKKISHTIALKIEDVFGGRSDLFIRLQNTYYLQNVKK